MSRRSLVVVFLVLGAASVSSVSSAEQPGKRRSDATECDPTRFEIARRGKTLWRGSIGELFDTHREHGVLGIGKRPDRRVVRLSRLLQSLKASKSTTVELHVCMEAQPFAYSVARVLEKTPDVLLAETRESNIRILEWAATDPKPRKRPKLAYKMVLR